MENQTIELQYFDGNKWITISKHENERLAWYMLGGDDYNYRTIDSDGNVLTDKSGDFFEE